ncbi:MAG TPA: hypothetical protein VGH43_16525 [Jatrophihabitans sp.]
MTPTSPLAGLLTGLLDGAIIGAFVFLVVFVLSHRRHPARVPVAPRGRQHVEPKDADEGGFRRAAR